MLLYEHLKLFYKKLIMQVKPKISLQEEKDFVLNCVRSYDRMGLPALALQMIVNLGLDLLPAYEISAEKLDFIPAVESIETKQSVNTLDWGEPVKASSGGLDWGEMEIKSAPGLDWSEMQNKPSAGLDWGEMESKPVESLDWGEMESSLQKLPGIETEIVDSTKQGFSREEVMMVTTQELQKMNYLLTNMKIYKKFLVMRILHDLHSSVIVINSFVDDLKSDPVLSDYFLYLKKGFNSLAEVTNLHVNKIGEFLACRAIEMHVGSSFIELLPFDSSIESFLPLVEKMLIDQVNLLCLQFFETNAQRNQSWYLDIERRSVELLRGWRTWQRKCPDGLQSQSLASLVLVTGYVIHLVVSAFLKKPNRLWWMCGLSEQFFDFLLKEKFVDLGTLMDDILSDKPAVSHPDEHHEQKDIVVEFYDEYGIALFNKDSRESLLAESLIYAMLISHIMSALEIYLSRLSELMNVVDSVDATFSYLAQSLDKPMITFLHKIDYEIAEKWREYSMDLKNLPAYLLETNVSDLLTLLYRTADFKKSSSAILNTRIVENNNMEAVGALIIDSDLERVQTSVKSELIVSSNSTIVSFALNPLKGAQLAYATGKFIHEIDLNVSGRYYGSSTNKCNFLDSSSVSLLEKNDDIRLSNIGLEALNIQREVSFDSMRKMVRRSFQANAIEDVLNGDTGLVSV